jgi:uncharacterized protein YdaU (DUF1376 family)
MADIDAWMPWHIAEYLADTMHLSTLEHGAYLLILAHGWRNDGMIAANERNLSAVSRLPVDQWRTIKPTIERFFTLIDHPMLGACWMQKRQVEEIRKAKEFKSRAVEKSKKAASARWHPGPLDAPSIPQAILEDCPAGVKVEGSSSSPGGDPRGGAAHVRTVLAAVDPGHLMPAPPGPPNLGAAAAALKTLSAKDEFWDPLCRIFGLEPKTIADEQRLWQQCVDFRTKGATVPEVERRAGNYRLHFSTAFTPKAVLSNWEILKDAPAPKLAPNERPRPTRPRITA